MAIPPATIKQTTGNIQQRYTISIELNGQTHVSHANTHEDIAKSINATIRYDTVSKVVIINWLCRKVKSPKYGFISITQCQ